MYNNNSFSVLWFISNTTVFTKFLYFYYKRGKIYLYPYGEKMRFSRKVVEKKVLGLATKYEVKVAFASLVNDVL